MVILRIPLARAISITQTISVYRVLGLENKLSPPGGGS